MTGLATGKVLREDGDASTSQGDVWSLLSKSIMNGFFQRKPGHGLLKFTVGKLGQALGFTTNTDKLFDVAVPRRYLVVGNGPWNTVAICRVSFEIFFAEAVCLSAPRLGSVLRRHRPGPRGTVYPHPQHTGFLYRYSRTAGWSR